MALGALGVFFTLSGEPVLAKPEALPAASSSAQELSALLGRVGQHAERLQQMEKRGSFLLRGRMEELDGQGRVDGEKQLVLRVTATPSERITEILSYLEDGADKTNEARDKHKKDSSKPEDPKSKFILPFLPAAQHRYQFTLEERSTKDPNRARVAFKPTERALNTYVGSAWVDLVSGEILTLGLSPTKNPMFVDYIEVQVRFENQTALGRAPSALSFEARGSLLFFKKRYRGSATLTDAKISF